MGNEVGTLGIPCKDFGNGCGCQQCKNARGTHKAVGSAAGHACIGCKDFYNGCRCQQCKNATAKVGKDGCVTRIVESVPVVGYGASAVHAFAKNKEHAKRAAVKCTGDLLLFLFCQFSKKVLAFGTVCLFRPYHWSSSSSCCSFHRRCFSSGGCWCTRRIDGKIS
jgi:hypothetical protein